MRAEESSKLSKYLKLVYNPKKAQPHTEIISPTIKTDKKSDYFNIIEKTLDNNHIQLFKNFEKYCSEYNNLDAFQILQTVCYFQEKQLSKLS